MNPEIIFEDNELMVISKPSGMVCNRSRTVQATTLQDWIESKFSIFNFQFSNNSREFVNRSGMIHRLDKETSGVLVLAKNPEAFIKIQAQFKARTVSKKYLALVHGKVSPQVGDISAPIKRNPFNRFRFTVAVDGRPSTTSYKVLDFYQNPKESNKSKKYYSLIEVLPKTGRTHQIRVHFSHLHNPVVADESYAGRKTARADRNWCPRLFLHAKYLSFNHPLTGQKLEFEALLPKDLQSALEKREKIPLNN